MRACGVSSGLRAPPTTKCFVCLCVDERALQVLVPPKLRVGALDDLGGRRLVVDGAVTQRARNVVRRAKVKRRLVERVAQQAKVDRLVFERRRRRHGARLGKHRHDVKAAHFAHLVRAERADGLALCATGERACELRDRMFSQRTGAKNQIAIDEQVDDAKDKLETTTRIDGRH